MNTLSMCRRGLAIALVLLCGLSLAFARVGPPSQQGQARDSDVQDLVFLGEARPVLIRLHIHIDGKTIEQAWDDFVKHVFAYLDVNGDGFLDTAEAERVPSIEQIQAGVLGAFTPRRRAAARDKMAMQKTMAAKKDKTDMAMKKEASPPKPPAKADKDGKKPSEAPLTKPSAKTEKDGKKPPAPPSSKPIADPKKQQGPPVPEPTMLSELDTNKDGKVSLAELADYFRKSGFKPFHVHLATPQANPLEAIGIGSAEPSAEQISDAIFSLLDTRRSGKLSRQELTAAPAVLLRLDTDEDEIITPRELVPNPRSSVTNMFRGMMGGSKGPSAGDKAKMVMALSRPGEVPADLVKAMQERYGRKGKKPDEKKLTRAELGLDEATFRQLDTNGDGVLDGKELAGFVKRRPDVELIVRVGEKKEGQATIELATSNGAPAPLAGNVTLKDQAALLDLGVTRAEVLSGGEEPRMDYFINILRTQLVALFKAADKGNKGYVTREDIQKGPAAQFATIFPLADRDNDGKLTEKELHAFLDKLVELQERAMASSVTLVLSFDSRGLFDLLDTDGDGRLSVREMRGAVGMLAKFDRQKKGYLTKADIPHTAKLTLRRGPSGVVDPQLAAVSAFYGGGNTNKAERVLTAGPLWFRKMDRNRDGDVSRKEWLFSEELFRKIDTDGDGLISLEEAERYEATRKKEASGG
jgi:Ca2+-binding EF-hand superfamily protein